jgi:hypothetical protein
MKVFSNFTISVTLFLILVELALVKEVGGVLTNELTHGLVGQLHVKVDESSVLLGFLCRHFPFLFLHRDCCWLLDLWLIDRFGGVLSRLDGVHLNSQVQFSDRSGGGLAANQEVVVTTHALGDLPD